MTETVSKNKKNESEESKQSNDSANWIDKLKPSARNKVMQRKFQNLSESRSEESLTNMSLDLQSLSIIDKNINLSENSAKNGQIIGKKWKMFVEQAKYNNFQIANKNNESIFMDKNDTFDLDNSIQFFEEIGNMIEEKCKTSYSENMFLKQQENHSIIPFLLISSKEVHRVCLSDYEIKYTYKLYKSKTKSFKAEGFDYYRIGLINIYKGKYKTAYNSFKNAIKYNDKDLNYKKWFCFVSIILLFCDNNKIDFRNMKKMKFHEEINLAEENKEEDGFSFFPCCSSRKGNGNNTKIKTVQMPISENNGNDYLVTPTERDSSHNYYLNRESINKETIAKEVMEYINFIIVKEASKNLQIEGWWIYLIISVFCTLHTNQKLFTQKLIPDPKYCVKKIKELDDYLSYIAYADFNYIINENFDIDILLRQLLSKYPNKVEAYLKYWQLLIKGKHKNFEIANSISEIYWKNSSTLQFDDGMYNLYILITHALSAYMVGNHFYSITYFQKEYPSNFLFPTIFYLFGKYSSKSNSKSLKNISISSLKEVYRLLYEDLQYSVLFWLGNIYYNTGNYFNCYKLWKRYLENADKSFDITNKKADRIKSFLKKYEVIWNSLNELKKNIKFIKRMKFTGSNSNNSSKNNIRSNSTANSSIKMNNFNSSLLQSSNLNNQLKIIQYIRDLDIDTKLNKSIVYDYYTALCYFYIDKNITEAMKILMNILNIKKHYMPALFAMWKVLAYLKEYKLLLNFSYYMVKISHLNEVNTSDWIKSYILFSKALKFNRKNDEAITILINTLDVYSHIPLEEAKYLNTIYNQNKISTTNFFVNFEKVLQFYSKYHIYNKSSNILNLNYESQSSRRHEAKEKVNLIDNDMNEDATFNNKNTVLHILNNINTTGELLNSNVTFSSDNKDINIINTKIDIDSIIKLEEYLEQAVDSFDMPKESPYITVISNPEIFLEIGKTCAKTETKRELGLICLEDYIHLLKFIHNYKLDEKRNKKKQKAYFWMSILHIHHAKQYIDKIDKLYEIDAARKKTKIVKLFIEFYKQHVSFNDSISFDFEISKEDLNEI